MSNDDLVYLGQLSHVFVLRLDCNDISEEGLSHLEKMPKLEFLSVAGIRMKPSCIEQLSRMRHLNQLAITQTDWTPEDKIRLRQALPHGCSVIPGKGLREDDSE